MADSRDFDYKMFDFEQNIEAKKWIRALRRAWLTEPSVDHPQAIYLTKDQILEIQASIQDVIDRTWDLDHSEWATLVPTAKDFENLHTHWRRHVLSKYFEFFGSVYERLKFDLPTIDDLEVGQHGIESEGVWFRGGRFPEEPTSLTNDALIIPAYLRLDTTLSVHIGTSVDPVKFRLDDPHEILWVRKGVEFSFRPNSPPKVVVGDHELAALVAICYIE